MSEKSTAEMVKELTSIAKKMECVMTPEQNMVMTAMSLLGTDPIELLMLGMSMLTREQHALMDALVDLGDESQTEEEIDLSVPGGAPGDMYASGCSACPAFKGKPLAYRCTAAKRAAQRAAEKKVLTI